MIPNGFPDFLTGTYLDTADSTDTTHRVGADGVGKVGKVGTSALRKCAWNLRIRGPRTRFALPPQLVPGTRYAA